MVGLVAIVIALPEINDPEPSVTPIFLLIYNFLYRFSTFVYLCGGFKCLLKKGYVL